MGIGRYSRAMVRMLWLVVLLALLAGGASYWALRATKDGYKGSVDVTVPAVAAATAGSNGQYVANFIVGLTTPSVLSGVSAKTGESQPSLSSGLSATQLGNSSFITLTYTAQDQSRAKEVVQEAAAETSALLARPAIDMATVSLESANKSLALAQAAERTAQAALAKYTATYGAIDPTVLYSAAQSSVTQLTVGKQQALAQGRSTDSFDTAIEQAQAHMDELAPRVAQYQSLTRAVSQAQLASQTAQTRVIAATDDLAVAQAAPLIGSSATTLVPRRVIIARGVAVAAGLGLVLGFALVVVALLVGSSRAARVRERAIDGPRAALRSDHPDHRHGVTGAARAMD